MYNYYVECGFCGSPVDSDTGYCRICKEFRGAMTQEEVDKMLKEEEERGKINTKKEEVKINGK